VLGVQDLQAFKVIAVLLVFTASDFSDDRSDNGFYIDYSVDSVACSSSAETLKLVLLIALA
jgi:hypothetical protein